MGLRGLRDLLLPGDGPFLLDLVADLRDEAEEDDEEDEESEPDEELDEEEDDDDEDEDEELELRDRRASSLGTGTFSSLLGSAGGGLGTLSGFKDTKAAFEELASGSDGEGLLEDLTCNFCCFGDIGLGPPCSKDPLA